MMKRSILAVILVLCAFFCAYGQNSAPIDLILLLDTSSNMGSSYQNVNSYVTRGFLSEYLRLGDTFHLIAFSDKPRFDVARRIQSRGDLETIIGRILLQYPLESPGNIRAALNYAEDYAASLPARPKKIVLISTGGADTDSLVSAAKQRLGSKNTTLDFILVTPGQSLTNLPRSGRAPAAASTAAAAPSSGGTATGGTAAATPGSGGTTPSSQTQTQTQTPSSSATGQTAAGTGATGTPPASSSAGQSVTTPSASAASGTGTGLGLETGASSQTGSAEVITDDSGETFVLDDGSISVEETFSHETTAVVTPPIASTTSSSGGFSSRFDGTFSVPLIIGLILLALLVLGLIIFFSSRSLRSSPNRVMAAAAATEPRKASASTYDDAPFADHSKDLASYAAASKQRSTPYTDRPRSKDIHTPATINPTGPLLLNLFVEDQNTAIGKRNIHSLKSGYSLKVGGGKSDDYYIFLVPLPSNLGEIRRNGSQCTFVPRKPKYFPDTGSNEIRDCVNKTIRIVSDKNYEICFRFEMYEDPLIALNRILHSVKVPG